MVTPGDAASGAARDRAVWLAELATWRRGFIGAVVERCGGLSEALQLEARELAARLRAGRSGRGAGEDSDDASLFAALLARGPQAGAAARPDVVTWLDAAYPPQLRDLCDPPAALFLAGCVAEGLGALAERHVVAVVGSRSPSPYGREMARVLARDLAAAGVLVVSGLALGVDAVAHEAALDAVGHAAALDAVAGEAPLDAVGHAAAFDAVASEAALDAGANGTARGAAGTVATVATVAVLGCGADVEHPPSNRPLFARVRAGGLLVSEFSWGVGARPWRFPARNRVMAALSEAVVAVEGAERSGALITAREALDLGREVLAVPGEAGRRLSQGPHRLLRQGAALCESARDVLEVLGLGDLAVGWRGRLADAGRGPAGGASVGSPAASPTGDTAGRRLLAALDAGAQTVDRLGAAVGLDAGATLAALAVLEIQGAVVACGGGAYRLRRDA